MAARSFGESEKDARRRAERDWATRDRITNAHDHLADAHGVDVRQLRRMTREGLPIMLEHLRRAGLTIGEARAAGLKIGG